MEDIIPAHFPPCHVTLGKNLTSLDFSFFICKTEGLNSMLSNFSFRHPNTLITQSLPNFLADSNISNFIEKKNLMGRFSFVLFSPSLFCSVNCKRI